MQNFLCAFLSLHIPKLTLLLRLWSFTLPVCFTLCLHTHTLLSYFYIPSQNSTHDLFQPLLYYIPPPPPLICIIHCPLLLLINHPYFSKLTPFCQYVFFITTYHTNALKLARLFLSKTTHLQTPHNLLPSFIH